MAWPRWGTLGHRPQLIDHDHMSCAHELLKRKFIYSEKDA